MPALETCVLYLLVGLGIAVAVAQQRSDAMNAGRIGLFLGTILFWPLLGPLLLSQRNEPPVPAPPATRTDEAQQRLSSALGSLDGLAGDVVAPEVARVRTLTGSITAMEHRLDEMDALLTTTEFDRTAVERTVQALLARGLAESDARVASARGRQRNIDKLRAMREQTSADLERVLLQIEEMSAQLKLLKLAGGTHDAGDAVRIVRQVADGLQQLTDAVLTPEQPGP